MCVYGFSTYHRTTNDDFTVSEAARAGYLAGMTQLAAIFVSAHVGLPLYFFLLPCLYAALFCTSSSLGSGYVAVYCIGTLAFAFVMANDVLRQQRMQFTAEVRHSAICQLQNFSPLMCVFAALTNFCGPNSFDFDFFDSDDIIRKTIRSLCVCCSCVLRLPVHTLPLLLQRATELCAAQVALRRSMTLEAEAQQREHKMQVQVQKHKADLDIATQTAVYTRIGALWNMCFVHPYL